MIANSVIFGRKYIPSFPIQSEYQAILDKATSLGYDLPNSNQQNLDNNVIYYLKQEGIWSKLDLLYMFERYSSEKDFAKINWIDPDKYLLTSPSMPSFSHNIGFTSDGTSYINTNYTPSTNSVNAVLNDICSFHKGSGSVNPMSVYGTRNSSANNFWQSAGLCYMSTSTSEGAVSSLSRTHSFNVKNGTNQKNYNNGILNATASKTSSTLSTFPLLLFALNNGGNVINISSTGFSLHYFGLGASAIESKQLELFRILNHTFYLY